MKRAIALIFVSLLFAGCTFDPSYDVTCSDEGSELGDKVCRGGLWIASTRMDADLGADMGGDTSGPVACVPQTDEELCAREGFNCGSPMVVDNCFTNRTPDCGTCAEGSECGVESDNVCFCPDSPAVDSCEQRQACGILDVQDACGNTVPLSCGECEGLASCVDNSCSCDVEAACASVGANCGMVDVTGQCAGTDSINCGPADCGEHSFCGDDNVCACEDGYSGDGIDCQDVDECAIGTHTCDPNAECTNTEPGYECKCREGFDGDGETCVSNTQLVKAVRNVLINVDNVAASMNYAPVVAANSVPFLTQYVRDTGEEGDRLALDVYLSGDDEVTVERRDNLGSAVAAVSVVEFEPGQARVQSGTFDFNQDATNVTLARPVDPTQSFIVFYYQRTNNADERRHLSIAANFANGGDEIHFEREGTTGNVTGHYWVVEPRGGAFAVQHVESTLGTDPAVNLSIQSVDTTKSMVLFSSLNSVNGPQASRSHIRCTLMAANVKCDRSTGIDPATVRAQVVTFAGESSVQRGEIDFVSGIGEDFAALTTVDDTATAFGGAIGLAGVQEQASVGEAPGGFFTTTIVSNGTQVKVQRGDPRQSEAKVSWQVIDW